VDEPAGPIARECVEGYLFARPPLELLVFRRKPVRGRIWVPVSGKVESSDPDLESALRRELAEETGLAETAPLFDLDWQVRFRADNGEVWRLHAYGVEVPRGFAPRLSDEHEAAEWVAPSEAIARLHYADNRTAVERLMRRLGAAPSRNP
jgi:8-oxo-dGTP diphosphatase